jgi:Tfp pilus assembly protein PilN
VSQVNLLPPELRQRQAVRRLTSIIVAAGLGVLALIGVFFFLQTQKLSQAQEDLQAQETRNEELQGQIAELQQFADLEAELAAKETLVASLFVNEVSWSGALLDVSRVIPDSSFLTSIAGQVSIPAADPAAPVSPANLIGTITFAGQALQTETLATWLTRLEQIDGWVNAWVSNAAETAPFSEIYVFASGIDLTIDATTERAQGEVLP